MGRFVLSIVVALALMSPALVFAVNPRPIGRQWENICLGAQVWKDALLGKRSLP